MQTVSFAGSSYNIPNTRGDRPWSGLSDFVIAAASKAINTAGGNFTLLANINFGATFGLVSAYYTSRTASAASAGQLRLASADTIKWRNNAGDGDIALAKNSSNELLWNTSRIILAGGGLIVNADVSASAAIAYSKLNLSTSIMNADVNAAAAIAYSKLALTASIVNADVSASAAIAYSKLALTGLVVNADIGAAAAIAYSKLALTGSVVNADIGASAAIAYSKLASLTSAHILVGSAGNVATDVAVTGDVALTNGGVTSITAATVTGKALTGFSSAAGAITSTDTILTALNKITNARIVQIVPFTTTGASSFTSSTFANSGVGASITPTATTSKILIWVTTIAQSVALNNAAHFTITRGSTNLAGADGFATLVTATGGSSTVPMSMCFLDSPATTSSTTYNIYARSADNTNTIRFGAANNTTVIMLVEISAGS